ncbi:flagellar hook-basal body protein [Fodinibius halophilus]|uniref:Flagellar hook basal-body protein n=1 Tax=Fodinibius halophilus TaxID=1736908 RepID=A0A6M1T078_9BACT|nr:flagellar hook basal-body protein [Fodinibius halophilus]NGP87377.1 flagellar hook basal-body protein [Fodinibius halophilus]
MTDSIQAQMQAMQMLRKAQDVTANNLANINTPGFKGSKVFYRMVQEEVNGESVTRPMPQQQVDMSQGVLEPTGNDLDFGIKGKGFFVVQGENSQKLTRDGRMHVSSDGYLVDGRGAKVMGDSGPIYMPQYLQAGGNNGEPAKVELADDGTIRLNSEVLDKLKIVKVEDTSQLDRQGSNYFAVQQSAMIDDNASRVRQGYYESGNVSPLNEMVDMMQTTKMFETQQRAIRTTDEMLGQVTSKLGKF